jgi:tetratricopeptide (TPR) repeat protein
MEKGARFSAGRAGAGGLLLLLAWLAATGAFYEWGGAAGRGVRELKKKQDEAAVKSLRDGKAELPNSAAVRYDQALAFSGVGSPDSAAAAYRDALDQRGNRARASAAYNLGNDAMRFDQFGRAASLYRESLRLDPSRVDAKRNLEEAIRRARQAAQSPPPQGGGGKGKPPPDQPQQDTNGKQPPPTAPPEQKPGQSPQLGSKIPDRAEAEHWLDALESERKAARQRDKGGPQKETNQRDW